MSAPTITLTLSRDDAMAIADALELLAGVDEGENTDYDNLLRLAALVRGAAGKGENSQWTP